MKQNQIEKLDKRLVSLWDKVISLEDEVKKSLIDAHNATLKDQGEEVKYVPCTGCGTSHRKDFHAPTPLERVRKHVDRLQEWIDDMKKDLEDHE